MSSVQSGILRRDWPQTAAALAASFLPGVLDAVTDDSGHNLAGHVLFYLSRAFEHALGLHGSHNVSRFLADKLFAQEVQYQARRQAAPRNVVAMLGTCWYNLVHERGERWKVSAARPTATAVQRFPRQCDTPKQMAALLPGLEAGRVAH